MTIIIKLNNIAIKPVTSKCTTPSETEGECEIIVKMYGKVV